MEQRLENLERALSFVLAQNEVRKLLSGPQVSISLDRQMRALLSLSFPLHLSYLHT